MRTQRLCRTAAASVFGFAFLAGFALSDRAFAGANFGESFESVGSTPSNLDGPQNLVNQGWTFRNQSQSRGTTRWFRGDWVNFPGFTPHGGTYYLYSTSSWDAGNRTVSTWAILPAVSNQAAGDVITLYYTGAMNTNDRMQVRYSPSGGTSTGSSVTDVGDFTQLLVEGGAPADIGEWDELAATVPGTGRLAIRWCNTGMAPFTSPFVAIDSLTVGPPPCNEPPLPAAGGSVTWTAANSPYQVCDNRTIPAGGTVIVEPGVTINFSANTTLTVEGTLQGTGTAVSPIRFNAAAVFPAVLAIRDGTVNLAFAEFMGQLRPYSGADVLLCDCTFTGPNGLIWSNGVDSGPLFYVQPYFRMERCTFVNSSATLTDCVTTLTIATFNNSSCWILRGYVDTTGGVTMNGRPFSVDCEAEIQGVYIDNVHVTGVATGAGLNLTGATFDLGPGNVTQNNLYPVGIEGGLASTAVIPVSGNTQNRIYAGDAGALVHFAHWPKLSVPYLVDAWGDNPDRIIDPGVTVEFAADAGMNYRATARIVAEGLPDAPITFKAAIPGQQWHFLSLQSNSEANRFEYCTIRDCDLGISASDAPVVSVDNCLFQDNQNGANANTYGGLFIRKSQFLNNASGVSVTDNGGIFLNFPDAPNSFVGNAAGIETLGFYVSDDARHNWWGSPSGPQSPLNPGGSGDAISGPGASGIAVNPFQTTAPNFANHPPVVRLEEPGYSVDPIEPAYYFEPGQKVILRWQAFDDDSIVSQRVVLSESGDAPWDFATVATLPANARSYELTVPSVPFDAAYWNQFIRVVAVDSLGQEGWDETPCTIAAANMSGTVTINMPGAGQTFYAGDAVPSYTRTVTGFDGWFPTLTDLAVFEVDGSIYLSGGPVGQLPNVSSDLVRVWTLVQVNSNEIRWFPGPYFTIRHDPRLGFVPPSVQLQTPSAGQQFPGGGGVPITWDATAAEGLRSFDIQVSTDGGMFWRVLVRDLPPDARSFHWPLPPSTGIADARVRVIVRDTRFQNSSSGADRAFSILSGSITAGDVNCDGSINPFDIQAFITALSDPAGYGSQYPNCDIRSADVNGDGTVNPFDIQPFIGLLAP